MERLEGGTAGLRQPWKVAIFTLAVMLVAVAMVQAAARAEPLRVGLTPVFLDDQPRITKLWRDYLESRLGREVEFVQRATYREIVDLLLRGGLDVAWICGLPYVERIARLSLVATPVYQGAPLYRSYLIVPSADTTTHSWTDLPHGVFAFSDPDSNSGYLYPRWAMRKAGIDVDSYFRKTFFTRSHRSVVEAVAARLADAGAVDGYIWDTLALKHPELTAGTRVVLRSETFGFPPIVARKDLPPEEILELRRVLGWMEDDPAGREVLEQLNLDGFTRVSPALYDGIAAMSRALGRMR